MDHVDDPIDAPAGETSAAPADPTAVSGDHPADLTSLHGLPAAYGVEIDICLPPLDGYRGIDRSQYPRAGVHPVGCVCEDCSAAYEREKWDPRERR